METAPAGALLARGAALLDVLGDEPVPTLRWYRSTTPAIILGRGQGAPPSGNGLAVVTRPSGGGAVLMDEGLLSLDALVPTGHPLLAGDLVDVFLRIGRVWAGALRDLGVPDVAVHEGPATARRLGSARERLLASLCYATLGRGEVVIGRQKIVGLAQRRRRHGALVQCGLLRRWRPEVLLTAFGADPGDHEVAAAAAGLDDLLDPAPPDEAVSDAVERRLKTPSASG
jgi:lipoate---protein ligase